MDCEMFPHSPHISTGHLKKTGVKHIDGKVDYRCRLPVESHHLYVKLERADDGDYRVMASGSTDKPPKSSGKRTTFMVVFPDCVSGEWRTAARATTVFKGKTYTTPVRHSRPHHISC